MKFISEILLWIDDNINHTIIDWFFDLFDYNKDTKFSNFVYHFWRETFRKFCYFSVDLWDKYHD